MVGPLELGIGLRYLRARRRTRFVSFITLASSVGIAVGVAALIVILSVMNGFENELRTRLLSMTAHASVTGQDGVLDNWREVRERVLALPGVAAAAPYVEFEAMARAGGTLQPLFVTGVDPALESGVSAAASNVVTGSLESLQPGSFNVVLGRLLALNLGVRIGDELLLLIPRIEDGAVQPELRRFRVSGLFEAGLQEHDAALALVPLSDAASILRIEQGVSGLRLRTDDVMQAPAVARALGQALGPGYTTSDWSRENASYFRAVRLEKTMMSLILSLIIAVAAFNIVASLVMVVTDKETDIAILRTLGMAPGGVTGIFLTQGLVIGWLGALAGVVLGTVLAINVPVIVPVLEQLFGFRIMPGDVYYVTEIPSDLQASDVVAIALAALTLTGIATLYPARRAARVHPARALRYE